MALPVRPVSSKCFHGALSSFPLRGLTCSVPAAVKVLEKARKDPNAACRASGQSCGNHPTPTFSACSQGAADLCGVGRRGFLGFGAVSRLCFHLNTCLVELLPITICSMSPNYFEEQIGPYEFRFYAADRREPPHVHIFRDGATAKIWLEDPPRLEHSRLKPKDLRRATRVVEENLEYMLSTWYDFFG